MSVPKGSTKARRPTVLKIIRGTENVTLKNKREPASAFSVPAAPSYFTKAERTAYDRFGECLDRTRVCTKDDFAALELLATTYCEMQRLRQALRDEDPDDLTYETFNKYGAVRRIRPELSALADVDRRLLGLLGRFGLTPADRGRVDDLGVDADGKPVADPEAEFT